MAFSIAAMCRAGIEFGYDANDSIVGRVCRAPPSGSRAAHVVNSGISINFGFSTAEHNDH